MWFNHYAEEEIASRKRLESLREVDEYRRVKEALSAATKPGWRARLLNALALWLVQMGSRLEAKSQVRDTVNRYMDSQEQDSRACQPC